MIKMISYQITSQNAQLRALISSYKQPTNSLDQIVRVELLCELLGDDLAKKIISFALLPVPLAPTSFNYYMKASVV